MHILSKLLGMESLYLFVSFLTFLCICVWCVEENGGCQYGWRKGIVGDYGEGIRLC